MLDVGWLLLSQRFHSHDNMDLNLVSTTYQLNSLELVHFHFILRKVMEKDVDNAQSWWAVHQVGLHLVEVLSCIRCWGDAPTTQHQGPREGVLVHWPVKIKDASQG